MRGYGNARHGGGSLNLRWSTTDRRSSHLKAIAHTKTEQTTNSVNT
ncbi:MAG: hypothetical protein ACYT04_05625 [Nostoc sp.]